jgi:uncharacterized protein (DUF1499 family)
MRFIIIIVSIIALALAAALAMLGPGVQLGWWDYGKALGWMRDYLAMPVLVAAAASALMILLSLWKARGLAALALVATLAAGAAGYVPLKMRQLANANPFIHDITTDFENPPAIVAGAASSRKNPPEYVGAEQAPKLVGGKLERETGQTIAEAQSEAFPDIKPLFLEAPLEEAAAAARAVLAKMKLEILAEGPASDEAGSGWRIEAVATSQWYGFKDDFIVRLTPAEGGGTRVDVRSKSRVGLSDLGANAARVRAFMMKLNAAV